jgi:hypothetical protein
MISMKKNPILLYLLLLPFSFSVFGQQAYKGQLSVTDQHLSVRDGDLHVGMKVSYDHLKLPSDESLTLIPVLRSGDRSLELPSVVVNGTVKQRAYHRSEVLASASKARKNNNSTSVVVRNTPKDSRQLTYKTEVPYAEWMKDAVLMLRTRECGCNGKPSGMYEDRIDAGISFPQPRISTGKDGIDDRYLSLVNVVQLESGQDTSHVLRGTIPYWGTTGLDKLAGGKQDYEIYFRLREAVRSLEKENGTTVTKLQVTGYGAPSGNYRKNEKAAAKRALELKDYLRENYVVNKIPLEVTWMAEDWDSIRSLVQQSGMPLEHAVTDIISTVDLTKGRERVLMNLAGGTPYRYLQDRIFPRIRRVEYVISYSQHRLDTAEGRRLFELGSRSLKLSEFFNVAMSYPKGSNEYNDALDLAARLFPDSPEAAINAAGVALSKHDLKKAHAYLDKYATLPAAYNNMGILYLLEGNRDKAEVYLQMAAAAGVSEAERALQYLQQK